MDRGEAAPGGLLENTRRLLQTRVSLCDGRELSPDSLREMSDFRRSIMSMKPEVDLDTDHEHFAGFITRCPIVVRVRDRSGALRGTFAMHWVDGGRAGRRWRLFVPDYAFFHPSLRGSPALPWAIFRTITLRPHLLIGREVFLGGVGYPTGALALEKVFGPIRLRSDLDLDGPTREVLDWLVTEFAGQKFDVATGRVWMPTRPPRPSARWFERMASRPTFARYVAQCPDWLDGYGLPLVCRVRFRDFAAAGHHAITRALRMRWQEVA